MPCILLGRDACHHQESHPSHCDRSAHGLLPVETLAIATVTSIRMEQQRVLT